MDENEALQVAEDAKIETALTIVKDIFYRLEETSQGALTSYDLLSYLTEDLIREGSCAACIKDAMEAAFKQTGANTEEHQQTDEAVLH